jgi:hypothetical protein
MTSNGEVERPRRSACLATRAHNLFPRPRRPTTCASRTVPTLVRGRPHRNYCARAESSAQTGAARGNEPRDAKRSHSRDRRSHRRQRCWWLPHLPARAQAEASGEGSWPRIFKSRSRTMRILGASSNGEVEGPHRSALWAPRAHTESSRPRRETTDVSRPPRTIVRRRFWHEDSPLAKGLRDQRVHLPVKMSLSHGGVQAFRAKNSVCKGARVKRRILLKLLPVRLSQAKANVHTKLIK